MEVCSKPEPTAGGLATDTNEKPQIFGFNGDLEYGLTTLMKGGKWIAGAPDPGMDVSKEGIRRQGQFVVHPVCLFDVLNFCLKSAT